jgi:hypothetical protein
MAERSIAQRMEWKNIDDVELSIAMSNFENSSSNYCFQNEIKHSCTCGGGASAIVTRALLGPDVSLTSTS